jgi:Coenzyme PQQ synthesis protein D (PqqD)
MALDVANDTPYAAVANIASCELGGEAVILNLNTGIYYGLDAVGTQVWRLLQHPRSLAELRDVITEEFDVSPDRCEADLHAFVGSLNSHGLLRPRDAATR